MSETLNKGLANLKCKMNIFKQNPFFKVPLTNDDFWPIWQC